MIARRTNTHPPRVSLGSSAPGGSFRGVSIDGKILPSDRARYFRTLYLRRGQWVPLPVLMTTAGDVSNSRAIWTLNRLREELPEGFKLERKRVPVFDEPNPDEGTYHIYWKLTTPDTLPPPARTGQPSLSGTDWVEVPLEEIENV